MLGVEGGGGWKGTGLGNPNSNPKYYRIRSPHVSFKPNPYYIYNPTPIPSSASAVRNPDNYNR